MYIHLAVKWIWIVLCIFWILAATVQKRTIRRQSIASRLLQVAILFLGVAPLFLHPFRVGLLGESFFTGRLILRMIGLLFTLAGAALAIWARIALGTNWSGLVTVKENHALITDGPYTWVRHPIYSGLLLALLGTALVQGKVVYLIVISLAAVALWVKLRTEERFMYETFGEEYRYYHQNVKALIPHVL